MCGDKLQSLTSHNLDHLTSDMDLWPVLMRSIYYEINLMQTELKRVFASHVYASIVLDHWRILLSPSFMCWRTCVCGRCVQGQACFRNLLPVLICCLKKKKNPFHTQRTVVEHQKQHLLKSPETSVRNTMVSEQWWGSEPKSKAPSFYFRGNVSCCHTILYNVTRWHSWKELAVLTEARIAVAQISR